MMTCMYAISRSCCTGIELQIIDVCYVKFLCGLKIGVLTMMNLEKKFYAYYLILPCLSI